MKTKEQINESTYLKVPDYILSSRLFSDSEILILSKIISLSNAKLGCIATDDWFADYFNKSRRQIQRILEKLRNDGWINSTINYGDPNNRSKVTKRKIELTQTALDLILHDIAPAQLTQVEPQDDEQSNDSYTTDDNDKSDTIDDNDKSDTIDDNDKSDVGVTTYLTPQPRHKRRRGNDKSDVDIILSEKITKKKRGEQAPPSFLCLGEEEDKGIDFVYGYIDYLSKIPFFKNTDEKSIARVEELFRYTGMTSSYELIMHSCIYGEIRFLNGGYNDSVEIHTIDRLLEYAYEYADKNNISTDGMHESEIYDACQQWIDAYTLFYEYERKNPYLLPEEKISKEYSRQRQSLIKQFYELLDKLGESRSKLEDTLTRIRENSFLSNRYLATPINLLKKDAAGNYVYWSAKAEMKAQKKKKSGSEEYSQDYSEFVN